MIRIRSPGRICLFGEHQDYLGYPVISLAISRYIFLEAKKINHPLIRLNLPDIAKEIVINLNNKEIEYENKRDYLRSGYNLCLREGFKFKRGYQVKITGNIPISAGVASSSALVIAWLYFLSFISNVRIKSSKLAYLGYLSEVKEFQEAGGMMDHYTSVFGKLIYLKQKRNKPLFINYDHPLDGFILGNSLEKKKTVEDLKSVKKESLKAFSKLKEIYPDFNPFYTSLEEMLPYLPNIEKKYKKKIVGNLNNRDITYRAKKLIDRYNNSNIISLKEFNMKLGELLSLHHRNLKKNIGISTKNIEDMIQICQDNGALGSKINGSGFGGTMFALCPGKEQKITKMLVKKGFEACIINSSNGVEFY